MPYLLMCFKTHLQLTGQRSHIGKPLTLPDSRKVGAKCFLWGEKRFGNRYHIVLFFLVLRLLKSNSTSSWGSLLLFMEAINLRRVYPLISFYPLSIVLV